MSVAMYYLKFISKAAHYKTLVLIITYMHDCQKGFCPGHCSVETIGLFYNFNIVTLITKSLHVCYRE